MGKKALQLASVASMIDQFTIPNIQILQSMGYSVDIVADFTNPGTITTDRAEDLKKRLYAMGARVFDIAIPRSLNPKSISSAYKKVRKLIISEHYDLIHCHSPIGGVICRQAAIRERKMGTKVIYTAHGFHFYDGAPIKNWLIYYPIEKHYSRYTDVLITINKEDYKRATKRFRAKQTVYIPGVGVDTEKFTGQSIRRNKIRNELGLEDDDILLLSVGELNENKNHSSVIKAIKGMNLTYVIVGKGEKKEELKRLAEIKGVDIRLPGYRTDIADFYSAADIYILPSIREGLNVSLMEAMASGNACCVSRIRGNLDLIDQPNFSPFVESEIKSAIEDAVLNKDKYGRENLNRIKDYSTKIVNEIVSEIYRAC